MPNRAAHAAGAAFTIGAVSAIQESQGKGEISWRPLADAWLAGKLGSLPDLLEPATSPRHRQFFHSAAFAAALGYGGYRLYQWKPESVEGKLLKWILLIAVGTYLTHLAMDLLFSRSGLPVVGKL